MRVRDARNEGVPLPSRALSHARGHLPVLRVLLDGPSKKETAHSLHYQRIIQIAFAKS